MSDDKPSRSGLGRAVRKVGRKARSLVVPPTVKMGAVDTSWVRAEPQPEVARPLEDFHLFAILSAWMEADVIAATVHNALRQGCEAVYLVDNDSPDDTVAQAVGAGAELARSFSTPGRYDEAEKYRIMHEVIGEVDRRIWSSEPGTAVWWLWIDADEFPHGPDGLTIRAYLDGIDERFRIVGARFLDHYPGDPPYAAPDRHPLDFQPLCDEVAYAMCDQLHRKHPLQRHDADRAAIECVPGFHMARSDERPLLEPELPIIHHHFPFRSEEVSRARLDALCKRNLLGGSRARAGDEATVDMLRRFRSLDAIYRHDWAKVENFIPGRPPFGVYPEPWTDLIEARHHHVDRWYDLDADLDADASGCSGAARS